MIDPQGFLYWRAPSANHKLIARGAS
jgi:hypothetical protein